MQKFYFCNCEKAFFALRRNSPAIKSTVLCSVPGRSIPGRSIPGRSAPEPQCPELVKGQIGAGQKADKEN
ncbi:Uncharacterized protein dnm_022150 [Desulfonema magnum]|uniref:Uncharacterized protein n=1 Tax=Desulfonema magnum TaxID=45655 RepID=A0A975BIA2_9BACT|nr:Uncharacterized protein dnm_022150 [Desulfonema magnum]